MIFNGLYYIFAYQGFVFYLIFFITFAPVVLFFYYLFHINELLIENRKMRLNKIIKNNPDKSEEELIKIIEEDAKGNIIGVIVTIIILFVVEIQMIII